ncbi:MAG TPA: Fur family transcriptional regulator [Candidatus Polarisedimenticolia bacterium]
MARRHPHALPSAELDDRLRSHGLRATRQRRAVHAALARHHDHPTAESLHREVRRRMPGLSLATVYKALEALVRAGASGRIVHADGVARYDARTDQHDHRRCLRCGRVEDLELPHRPDRIADIPGGKFSITGYRLELLGHCARCAAAGRPTVTQHSFSHRGETR